MLGRWPKAFFAVVFAISCFTLAQVAQAQNTRPIFLTGKLLGVSPIFQDLPLVRSPFHGIMPEDNPHPVPFGLNPRAPFDPALQREVGPLVSTTPGKNVLGLGIGFPGYSVCCVPPDTNASVGTTQVVETVNLDYEIFTKSTGAAVGSSHSLASLFSGTSGNCATGFMSDPVVKFDNADGRWVITFLAATSNPGAPLGVSKPFLQCFAVSKTSDATGSYFLYAFDVSSLGGVDTALNDYPKLGVWPDAYYESFDEFDAKTTAYDGNSPCAFQSSVMITGGAHPGSVCFLPIGTEFALLPSDLDGPTPPASGTPDFYVGSPDGSSHFNIWKFHVDFVTPSLSTFTGPTTLTTSPYSFACGGGVCIKQPSPGELLDSLGNRLMFRAAYRNFTGTGAHEVIVVSQSVVAGSSTGIRWYEIRGLSTTPTIFQQGTWAPDSKFRWMPSIGMDKVGDIALGYSVSSTTTDPSVRYTGRVPGDAKGKMESEKTIVKGTGVQEASGHRWGDYSSMAIDPSNDCTFWYAQEYIKTSATAWSTRLASFAFTTCH